MPASRAHEYWLAITPLEAKEVLLDLQVIKYPHLEKNKRMKFENSLRKQSESGREKKILTTKEIFEELKRQ